MDEGPVFAGVEIDADNNIRSEIPTWMRNAIDAALGGAGIRIGGGKKQASDEAIENLQELKLEDLASDSLDCPICFDTYVESEIAGDLKKDSKTHAQDEHSSITVFNDPALYFPVVESASIYTRYPPKCLETKVELTREEIFPDIDKSERGKRRKRSKDATIIHSPVKMPGCNHIFGKTCIVEWLKNNVSCPLCRKEVAAEPRDPKKIKLKEVRQQSSFQYVEDVESEARHIAERLTDIFHPFKRPFNSNVTPLTDRYIPQEWSRPHHSWEQERADGIDLNVPDPSLVLLRKYPLGGMSELPRRSLSTANTSNGTTSYDFPDLMLTLARTEDNPFDEFLSQVDLGRNSPSPAYYSSGTSATRDEVNDIREPLYSGSNLRGRGALEHLLNADTSGDEASDLTEPPTSRPMQSRLRRRGGLEHLLNEETSEARDEADDLREPLLSRPLQSILRGRGGPERSNRGSSRGHPYSRPDEP